MNSNGTANVMTVGTARIYDCRDNPSLADAREGDYVVTDSVHVIKGGHLWYHVDSIDALMWQLELDLRQTQDDMSRVAL